jgi:Flp pilus assembly protein TadG
MAGRPKTAWRRRANSGVAALELALMLPMLIALFVGITDFSLAYHQQMQLAATLGAAAEYAFTQGQTETGTTLTGDVTGFVTKVSPYALNTVSVIYNNGDNSAANCYCQSGSPAVYTGPVTCNSACADGSTAGKFVTLTGGFTYAPIFVADQVFFSGPIAQTVTVRLQ